MEKFRMGGLRENMNLIVVLSAPLILLVWCGAAFAGVADRACLFVTTAAGSIRRWCDRDAIRTGVSWECGSGPKVSVRSSASGAGHGSAQTYKSLWPSMLRVAPHPKKASRTETHGIKKIVMATVIEFYFPKNGRKSRKLALEQQLGKVIEFRSQAKKSA
jgi:hypothetical protein